MTVKPGYYRLSTLLMMLANVNRSDARDLIPGLTVNSISTDGFTDPMVDCTLGTITLSNEGDYVPDDSPYYGGGGFSPGGGIIFDDGTVYFDAIEAE